MIPYYQDGSVTIYHGDCRDVLPDLSGIETCVTDPPYGLSFMGKGWDHGVPGVEFWELIGKSLLPGAMCLAFGGTRTHHRLTCAIEDAGFEIRDCLMWLYGSGFPKSLDISKAMDKAAGAEREVIGVRSYGDGHIQRSSDEKLSPPIGTFIRTQDDRLDSAPATEAAQLWDGWGTALKPAWEPIVLAMKPLSGTFAQNAQEHGVAGLNIDGCRIGPALESRDVAATASRGCALSGSVDGTLRKDWHYDGSSGRWPANVLLDEDSAKLLDEQSGELSGPWSARGNSNNGRGGYGGYAKGPPENEKYHGDSGGASRFFYTAKASRSDRGENNTHPTVKPTDLMKWLVKLTDTPTHGTVLDPFMGSGTTVYAAKEMGRRAIGIELDEAYCEVAAKRCAQEVLALAYGP